MHHNSTGLANTTLVSKTIKDGVKEVNLPTQSRAPVTKEHRENSSTGREVMLNSRTDLLTEKSKFIVEASIRTSTKKKYSTYIDKWHKFCKTENLRTRISANHIVNFLSELYNNNASYSAIKSAKSALSHEICLPPFSSIGDHPLIRKFMKGVFNLRPPKAKCGFIWDVKVLFQYFDNLENNDELNDYDLTYKTLCLLVLLNGSRINTVHKFKTDEIIINDIGITITPSDLLKHSRQNRKNDIFYYKEYKDNKKLCVVSALKEYLKRRNLKVQDSEKHLFITYKKPLIPLGDGLKQF